MSESKMAGKVRRAIVRSDEGEVRRRVEPLGYPVRVDQRGTIHIDEFVTKKLADVGIFPGRDGWEIEVRRELPAPWAWWPFTVGGEFLARSDDNRKAIAFARSTGYDIYDSEDALVLRENIQCASLTEARERAEDECRARGLFGAVKDAPPVDRAQAIRDALLTSLADGNRASMPALLSDVVTATGDESVTSGDVLVGLGAIGAVAACSTWRLSDGAPPGWEWWRSEWGGLYLCPVGSLSKIHDSIANVTAHDALWSATEPREDGLVVAKGKAAGTESACAAALMACRRAGLFAPPVATEPTDTHRDPAHEATIADLEAQIAGLVARLVAMAEARDEATREVASWKDEHGRMHSDRDRQRKRVTELLDQLWATKAERDAARTNETDAGHRIATMEKALAQATAERDEARLNVVDARARVHDLERVILVRNNEIAHVTNCRDAVRANAVSWKARAEDAEGPVNAMRAKRAATGKATP